MAKVETSPSHSKAILQVQRQAAETPFDLVKITRTKVELNISPNTVRAMFRAGLPHYRCGKLVLVSRADVAAFIKSGAATNI